MQFRAAIQALADAQVEFVVTGGLSATLQGSARVTYDLNICFCRTAPNLRRLAGALAPFHTRPRGFPAGLPFLWDEATLRNGTIFTLHTDIGATDLLAGMSGLGSFDEVKQNSIIVFAFDREISTLDLPALIRAKRATGREKDLAALPELESLLDATGD